MGPELKQPAITGTKVGSREIAIKPAMTQARLARGTKWLVPGEFWDWRSRLIAGPRNYETDGALMEGFRSETNQNQRVKG